MTTILLSHKVKVLPCRGIGDALLMLIAAERLQAAGHDVVTIHPKLPELQNWFPHLIFDTQWIFSNDEWIIAQNDNSERVGTLKEKYRDRLSIFYPTYIPEKNGPLSSFDRVFNPEIPMAENIAESIASLLDVDIRFPVRSRSSGKKSALNLSQAEPAPKQLNLNKLSDAGGLKGSGWTTQPGDQLLTGNRITPSKENGINPPPHLSHRLHRKRVLIHHTSSLEDKNWLKEKFQEVAHGLKRRGFEPVFVPEFSSLDDLAAYVYQSGFVIGNDSLVGHLASNLQIPTVIVADLEERMNLWRPGWLEGSVVTLSPWIPNWKFFKKNWKYFISSGRVLSAFDEISRLY